MRVLKQAFTLAEVLIAMAIIGIIASITIPQVVKSTLRNETGAILGRTVEQIELGCQNIIQKANDNVKITDGGFYQEINGLTQHDVFGDGYGSEKMYGTDLFKNAGAFFGVSSLGINKSYFDNLKDFTDIKVTGEDGVEIVQEVAVKSHFPDDDHKELFTFNKQNVIVIASSSGDTTYIFIDVNGIDKPNRGGKDVFLFELNKKGKMKPYSGTCEEGNVGNGWGCASTIVKDGYRVTYY